MTSGFDLRVGGRDDLVATLRRAASWLHRDRFVPVTGSARGPVASLDGAFPMCEAHGVPHTGKLARSIILDLAVHDALRATDPEKPPPPPSTPRLNGPNPPSPRPASGAPPAEASWQRAIARARWVVSRLGTDPEHGGRIFLPGRLDPRNASTSLIDAGECVDALATLALHPRFCVGGDVPDADREAVLGAIRACAAPYLAETVTSKAIVNQVLWGAMGLAHACSVFPDERPWREAVVRAIAVGVDRQRPDGSWGYEEASAHAHPGVADLTVYYHGRCLAFLRHALDHVPEADRDGRASAAFRRGVAFLMAVRSPDGTKSLALEGKRWFWASTQEAGSLAYDTFVLARMGSEGGPEGAALLEAAWASWHTLRARIDLAGAVRAGDGVWPLGDAADVVCRDFHVADLAWVARSVETLRSDAPSRRGASTGEYAGEGLSTVRRFDDAGVVRLEVGSAVAVVRVAKAPNNTQWGGAIGGGTIVATRAGASEWRDAPVTPGSVAVYPVSAPSKRGASTRGPIVRVRAAASGVRRFVAMNRVGREGRQAAFNLRLVARSAGRHVLHGHPIAAARVLIGVGVLAWRAVAVPFLEALGDVATTHWATHVTDDATLELSPPDGVPVASWSADVVPARRDGSVPEWGRGVRVARLVRVDALGVQVLDRIEVDPPSGVVRVTLALPKNATIVRVRHGTADAARLGGVSGGTAGSGTGGRPPEEPGNGWRVWQGGASLRAEVRPRSGWDGLSSVPDGSPHPAGDGRRPEDGTNDGTLEVAYRLDG